MAFAPLCLPKWMSPCNQSSLNALWMLGTVHGCRLTRNMCWGLGEPWFVGETWQLQLAFAMGYVQFSSFQLLSHVQLFETPWTAARQASLSFTNSWILLKLMSIESVMPSNILILYRPILLLPSTFHSNRVFYNEEVLHISWPKYWSFSFSICPSNEYSRLISCSIDLLDLFVVQRTLKSLVQHHS